MADKNYSREDWEAWRDSQPRKILFTRMVGNLAQCKLCGNRYPLSPRFFMQVSSSGPEKLYGFIRDGLMFICRACEDGWGPDFKNDVNRQYRLARDNERQGKKKPIKPLAKGAA